MKYLNGIKLIIWDWNGTLLDDVNQCVEAMNTLLSDRKLQTIDNAVYKEVFTFPVVDYYQKLGFDFSKEPFEIPALQFMDLYRATITDAKLHNETISILSDLKSIGYKQAVLSAMEENLLYQLLGHYNITQYFDVIFGIDNHYGGGKISRGKELIHSLKINPEECLLIGDTLHDAEVANEIGCRCVLFDGGHQSNQKLKAGQKEIISKLSDIILPAILNG